MADYTKLKATIEALDCGAHGCIYAMSRGGMRTNGGCHCLSHAPADVRMRTHIVCGGCHDENSGEDAIGADMLAAHLALKAGVKIDLVPADWSQGKSGGPRRNQAMVDVADGLVCVRYPHSRGSADVVRRAETKGIPVVEMLLEDERAAAKPMRAMGGRW